MSVLRVSICIAAALAFANCDGRSAPTSPSSVTPGPPPPGASTPSYPTLTMNLTGTVTDPDGRPVADATVKASPFIPGVRLEPLTTTTGAPGRYEFTFENATGQGQGGGAVASKPGYEDDYRYVFPALNAVQNFRLYPITRVAAGATIRVTVLPDDGFCGLSDEWRCRKFRFVSPRNGTLTLTVTDEAGNAGGYLEILRSPYYCCQAPLYAPVVANEELRVHVLMFWASQVAQTFLLQTSLN